MLQKRIEELRPHELNDEIYGDEELPQDFLDSVKEKGILVSLAVKDDGTIISGHRRWRAAKAANMEAVPVSIVSFESELDEREAVITFNKQREKTFSQKMNEAEELEKIESERAKKRIKEHGNTAPGKKKNTRGNVSTGEQGKTRDKVAEKTGIGSGRTYDKAKKVWEAAKSGDEDAEKEVQKIDKGESSVHRAYRKIQQKERERERSQKLKERELPDDTFQIIYCDPPWQYSNSGFEMSAEKKYPTMSTEKLKEMKAGTLADENSVIFMWATNPLMPDALEVIKAWGFEYKTNFVWVKERHTAGFYNYGKHELLLVGVKGSILPTGEKHKSEMRGRNDVHSKKPKCAYEIIEKMYPGLKRVELFARNKREGWTAWGNEI